SLPSATPSSCAIVLNTGFEGQVASLINGARDDHGLGALSVQSQLRAAARVQATDMACNHFTGHTGSDGSSVRDRVEAQGYSWSWIGENFYVTHDTVTGPQTAFNWWMNSTPHRENILGASYTEFGVGYVYGPDSDYGGYFVVVFARPK
ncbi:MAG: CAP domain-containing protein, partial [Anaerolineales bacterium]